MEFKSLCGNYRFAFTRLQKLRKGKRRYIMSVMRDAEVVDKVRFTDWDSGPPLLYGFFRRRAALWVFNKRLRIQLPVGRQLIREMST